MELETLKAKSRVRRGKGGAREVRREGDVPGTIYGGGKDPYDIRVESRELSHLLHSALGEHALVQIEVEDKPDASSPALVKDVQHHPVRGNVIHADFLRIDVNKPIRTIVPLNTVGRAVGVIEGGILDHQLRELTVECLPLDVPAFIEVDVTGLDLGDSVHVSDLTPPENVTIITPGRYSIAAILQSRLTRIAEGGEEGIEGLEGEAAEGEEGAESDEKSEEGGE